MQFLLRLMLSLVSLGLAGLFALAFYDRYWRWRDCFNELGRCYDEVSQQVYLEQAGIAWGSLTLVSLTVALLLLIRLRRG